MIDSLPIDFFGFKLFNKGNGFYEFRSSFGSFVGNANQIINHAVLSYGFLESEIELGLSELNHNLHDVAEFGVFKSFMFSHNLEGKNVSHISQ